MSENKPPEDTAITGSSWEEPEANPEAAAEPTGEAAPDETAAAVDEQTTSEPLEPTSVDPYAASAAAPTATPSKSRFAWLGTKAALIGGAVALALATGLIGFGIGHAVSGDGGRSGDHSHHRDGGFGGERPDLRGGSERSTQG